MGLVLNGLLSILILVFLLVVSRKKEGKEQMSNGKGQGLVSERLLPGSGTRPQGRMPVSCFQETRQCSSSSVSPEYCLFNMAGGGMRKLHPGRRRSE